MVQGTRPTTDPDWPFLHPAHVANLFGAHRVTWLSVGAGQRAPILELPALVEYLRRTPDARPSLGEPAKVLALREELYGLTWCRKGPPAGPFSGSGIDAARAVGRACDSLGWIRIYGHPVRGNTVPSVEALVETARTQLATTNTTVRDRTLRRAARKQLAAEPWPFDILVAQTRVE